MNEGAKKIENCISTPNFMIQKNGLLNMKDIDSKIIEGMNEINFIYEQLKKITLFKYNNISFNLIFRATRDGKLSKNFHKKVDGIDKTFLIIKT